MIKIQKYKCCWFKAGQHELFPSFQTPNETVNTHHREKHDLRIKVKFNLKKQENKAKVVQRYSTLARWYTI